MEAAKRAKKIIKLWEMIDKGTISPNPRDRLGKEKLPLTICRALDSERNVN